MQEILFKDIPQYQLEALKLWLFDQTVPSNEGCYRHDYEIFLQNLDQKGLQEELDS